jgi:hypothetical protein
MTVSGVIADVIALPFANVSEVPFFFFTPIKR